MDYGNMSIGLKSPKIHCFGGMRMNEEKVKPDSVLPIIRGCGI